MSKINLNLLPALAVIHAVFGWNSPETVDVKPPSATGSTTAAVATISRLRVPIAVSIETLRQYSESALPTTISGSKGLGNFGPAAENSVSWNLARSPLSVSGADAKLSVATSIGGTVTVRGKIQPIRGDVGKILGKLKIKPSQPYSQTADIGADVSASAAPQLQADWSVTPNLTGQATMREASVRIAGIFDLSFRSELQGDVDKAVNNAVADLNARLAADRTLKTKAAEAWAELCKPLPVSAGEGLPDLSLRVSPRGFIATQPIINADGVRLDLGLDAVVRLTSVGEPAEDCPPFNETLTITESTDGVTAVSLRADLGFEALSQALETLRAEKPEVSGSGVEAELSRITVGPLGDRLLLAVDGTFSESSWFGASAMGTIYLAATPKLDAARQMLGFDNVSIDAASRDALSSVAVVLGNALSPLIESKLKDMTFDLKPEIEKARGAANAAAVKLKDEKNPVHVSEAALDDLKLAQLWHDDAGIHLTIEARGRIALEAVEIKP